jgi:hypothetical protein
MPASRPPENDAPTTRQADGDEHDTPLSAPSGQLGGVVGVDQVLPFQRPTAGPIVGPDTAVHAVGDGQEIPPTGFRKGSIGCDHVVPFQCSVNEHSHRLSTSQAPTAMQSLLDAHEIASGSTPGPSAAPG